MGDISALQGDENRQTPECTPAQLQPQLYGGGRNSELKTLFITHNFSSSRIRTNLRRIKKTLPAHVSGDIECDSLNNKVK